MNWLQRLPWRALGRWWIVGLTFLVVGSAILYVFVSLLRWPLTIATVVSAEITLQIRFLINDRWVFGHPRPAWSRLWQFHVASAGGSSIWWVVANVLPRFGIHYLIASAVGSACSVCFSMLTNFLWVWRRRRAC